ncbi:MAG: universal stress protein [Alphaproteobacteria bacterium]
MSEIKTILVHLADDEAHAARLDVAFDLANRFDAHIVALYVTTPITMPAAISGRGASYAYISQATEIAKEKASAMEVEFRARCENEGRSWEWLCEEGDHIDLLDFHARFADLAIVSPSKHHSAEDEVALHLPEQLPLQSSCPVLIVPRGWTPVAIGKNVVVGWKTRREAARAVRNAVPLLRDAERVTLVTVSDDRAKSLPGAEIATFLARHGVALETRLLPGHEGSVDEIILEQADELGADMIVIGAYGHSRLRELIFGGVTREIVYNTKVPVFAMH